MLLIFCFCQNSKVTANHCMLSFMPAVLSVFSRGGLFSCIAKCGEYLQKIESECVATNLVSSNDQLLDILTKSLCIHNWVYLQVRSIQDVLSNLRTNVKNVNIRKWVQILETKVQIPEETKNTLWFFFFGKENSVIFSDPIKPWWA